MVDVLSQSQIDALLKSVQSSDESKPSRRAIEQKAEAEETKYSRYDFYSPREFTKEKMKILTSIFENYTRIPISWVNSIFRVMTDAAVLEIQKHRYYEYVNSLYKNDCMTLVDACAQDKGKNSVPPILYTTPGLVLTLINHMLGGGNEVVEVDTSYHYSDVEVALYERATEYCTRALKDGPSNYIDMTFKVQRVGGSPNMVQGTSLDKIVVIIHLNVDMADLAVEEIRLCLPGTSLEYIFHMIGSYKHIARGFAYGDSRDMILDNIRYTQLPMTGQLAAVELDISDIYHLKADSVIDLNWPQNSKVKLFVGGQPWFLGDMRAYKKSVTMCIQNRIYGEPEDPLKMEELVSRELGNQGDAL